MNARAETSWVDVCAVDDLPALGARTVPRAGRAAIAIFRTATGEVFALDDRCPHKGGPLSQGIVFGKRVACPLHNWTIELSTGEAVAPDRGCAHVHPVRVENGRVLLAASTLDCAP
ncbi:MAG TPA: nitrite reductase small subunit NirD [Burkholderiaceae bacterium]|nr:nitrite reductase small subunit NirD [Burkholderiaceae bacterium]